MTQAFLNGNVSPEAGMTLRDYFAAAAMQALAPRGFEPDDLADRAYEMAEAMILERKNWED